MKMEMGVAGDFILALEHICRRVTGPRSNRLHGFFVSRFDLSQKAEKRSSGGGVLTDFQKNFYCVSTN